MKYYIRNMISQIFYFFLLFYREAILKLGTLLDLKLLFSSTFYGRKGTTQFSLM